MEVYCAPSSSDRHNFTRFHALGYCQMFEILDQSTCFEHVLTHGSILFHRYEAQNILVMTGLLTGGTRHALIYGERIDAIVTFMTLYLISIRKKKILRTNLCILICINWIMLSIIAKESNNCQN